MGKKCKTGCTVFYGRVPQIFDKSFLGYNAVEGVPPLPWLIQSLFFKENKIFFKLHCSNVFRKVDLNNTELGTSYFYVNLPEKGLSTVLVNKPTSKNIETIALGYTFKFDTEDEIIYKIKTDIKKRFSFN